MNEEGKSEAPNRANRLVARGRIAAHESWAQTEDKAARTSPARAASRAAMDAKFEHQVDPDGLMDPEARAAAVAEARSQYFRDLASRPRKNKRGKPLTQEEHAVAADTVRMAVSKDREEMYRFLMARLREEEEAVVAESKIDNPVRRRELLTSVRSLVEKMRRDGMDEYLRYLLVAYRDYPDCRAEWLL